MLGGAGSNSAAAQPARLDARSTSSPHHRFVNVGPRIPLGLQPLPPVRREIASALIRGAKISLLNLLRVVPWLTGEVRGRLGLPSRNTPPLEVRAGARPQPTFQAEGPQPGRRRPCLSCSSHRIGGAQPPLRGSDGSRCRRAASCPGSGRCRPQAEAHESLKTM